MSGALLIASLLTLPAIAPAAAQAPAAGHPVFPTAPTVDRLPSGLTVVTVPWNSPGIVAYYTLVRVGSRDEVEPGHSGFAHLFEHMMFRGTERFPEARYEETMQSFGADHNAYTTTDFTLYVITAPSAALDQLVEIEADRFQRLSYDEAQYRTETGAVLGEYNTRRSSPFLSMWEAISEMAFTRHTYGHTTLGYLRDICNMPEELDYSRRFFTRYYTPDNTTLVVAGDVDREALLSRVREHYGAWSGRRDRPRIPREAEPRAGSSRHIPWEGSAPPQLMLGYRIPGFDGGVRNPRARQRALIETAALQVVHGLAFHESSPLYQRLVVEEQILLSLGSWDMDFSVDPHFLIARATLKPPGRDFDAIVGAVQGEMDTIGRGEVPAERIAAVKSHIRYAMLSGLETPADAAELVAHMMAAGGSPDTLVDLVGALDAVTDADVARVAARYLTERRRYVVSLAEAAEGEEVPAPPSCESLAGGAS